MASRAEILITAQDRTNSAFTSVERSLTGLKTASLSVSSAIAALSTAGIAGFASTIVNGLDRLNDLSKTTGLAVNQLAGLGFAARQSGSDLDGVANAVSKLSVNIGKDAEKFRQLGITANDPLEAFKQLADVFVSIKDPQERAAVAAAALGKSWQDAAPMLAEGGAAIGRMVAEGEKASSVTADMAAEADKFNDQLELMKAKFAGVAIKITGDFLPAMNSVLDRLQKASESGGIMSFLTTSSSEEANAEATIANLKGKVASLRKMREELTAPTLANNLNNTLLGSLLGGGVSDIKTIDNQILAMEKKIAYLSSLSVKADAAAKSQGALNVPSKASISAFVGSGSDGEASARNALQGEQRVIQALRDKFVITKQLTELERVGEEIRDGKYKNLSVAAKQQLLILSAQIDSQKALNQAEEDQNALQKRNAEEGIARFKALEEAGLQVYAATRTDAQLYADEVLRLNDLLAQGAISQETYNAALEKTQYEYQKTAGKANEASHEMSQFSIQAARNAQTAFANFLFDPFDQGVKGMALGFIDSVRRMAAEAAAAQLFNSLFGGFGGGAGGGGVLGGVVGALFKGATSILGFAEGGYHSGGLRIVGERGPELEMTGPSRIFNANQTRDILSGSGNHGGYNIVVQVHVHTGVQQTVRAEFMSLIPTIRKEAVAAVAQARQRGKYGLS